MLFQTNAFFVTLIVSVACVSPAQAQAIHKPAATARLEEEMPPGVSEIAGIGCNETGVLDYCLQIARGFEKASVRGKALEYWAKACRSSSSSDAQNLSEGFLGPKEARLHLIQACRLAGQGYGKG